MQVNEKIEYRMVVNVKYGFRLLSSCHKTEVCGMTIEWQRRNFVCFDCVALRCGSQIVSELDVLCFRS